MGNSVSAIVNEATRLGLFTDVPEADFNGRSEGYDVDGRTRTPPVTAALVATVGFVS